MRWPWQRRGAKIRLQVTVPVWINPNAPTTILEKTMEVGDGDTLRVNLEFSPEAELKVSR